MNHKELGNWQLRASEPSKEGRGGEGGEERGERNEERRGEGRKKYRSKVRTFFKAETNTLAGII